jgi:hypothetical protein
LVRAECCNLPFAGFSASISQSIVGGKISSR